MYVPWSNVQFEALASKHETLIFIHFYKFPFFIHYCTIGNEWKLMDESFELVALEVKLTLWKQRRHILRWIEGSWRHPRQWEWSALSKRSFSIKHRFLANIIQIFILQGCILNLKFIFCPPPFLIYIFSPNEIYYIEGVRAAGEKFSAFFLGNFVNFKSIGEKYAYFLAIGD